MNIKENQELNNRFNTLNDDFINVSFPHKSNPIITDDNVISRYFIQKINDKSLIETIKKYYVTFDNNFYKKYSIRWKIRGSKHNIIKNNKIMVVGVEEFNLLQLNELYKNLPESQKFVNNPLQFYQGM